MRLSVVLTALLLTIGVQACRKKESSPGATTVILDDWYSTDYVRNRCKVFKAVECQTSAPEEIVARTDSNFEVAFAIQNACSGLLLSHFQFGETPRGSPMVYPPSLLILNIHPNSSIASWTLLNPHRKDKSPGAAVCGDEVTPDKLAETVCKIVKGMGGIAPSRGCSF